MRRAVLIQQFESGHLARCRARNARRDRRCAAHRRANTSAAALPGDAAGRAAPGNTSAAAITVQPGDGEALRQVERQHGDRAGLQGRRVFASGQPRRGGREPALDERAKRRRSASARRRENHPIARLAPRLDVADEGAGRIAAVGEARHGRRSKIERFRLFPAGSTARSQLRSASDSPRVLHAALSDRLSVRLAALSIRLRALSTPPRPARRPAAAQAPRPLRRVEIETIRRQRLEMAGVAGPARRHHGDAMPVGLGDLLEPGIAPFPDLGVEDDRRARGAARTPSTAFGRTAAASAPAPARGAARRLVPDSSRRVHGSPPPPSPPLLLPPLRAKSDERWPRRGSPPTPGTTIASPVETSVRCVTGS